MEEKKDREYFKTLAHHLMFDLSDEEADSIWNIRISNGFVRCGEYRRHRRNDLPI